MNTYLLKIYVDACLDTRRFILVDKNRAPLWIAEFNDPEIKTYYQAVIEATSRAQDLAKVWRDEFGGGLVLQVCTHLQSVPQAYARKGLGRATDRLALKALETSIHLQIIWVRKDLNLAALVQADLCQPRKLESSLLSQAPYNLLPRDDLFSELGMP